LQNPHSRKSELNRIKVKVRFRPSASVNMPGLRAADIVGVGVSMADIRLIVSARSL
jgi:hypothetical protein